MRFIRASLLRLLGTVAASRRERELADELQSHLQLHIDDNLRAGMPPAEARRQALLKFGAMEAIKEQHRDRAGFPVLRHTVQDLRFALRLLRKSPGFSVTAIVTIALAVGVNAAIFSILNAAALQSLPVPQGDRLATLAISFEGEGRRGVHGAASMLSYPEYEAVRDQSRALDGTLAFSPFNAVTLGGPEPRSVLATLASCNYFDVLRIRVSSGRALNGGDCVAGAPAVVVLSDRLWRTAFAADPALVGRLVMLNRAPFVVVGVSEAGFTGTQLVPEDIYVPVTLQTIIARDADWFSSANMSWLVVMGRMKPEASLGSVRADLGVIIVTESTARRIWPGLEPLDQVLALDKIDRPVVGVVRDAQVSRLGRTDEPFVFLPAGPDSQSRVQFLVAGVGAAPPAAPIRAAVADLDPQLAVDITRLEDNLEQWRAPAKLVAGLSGTLAILALVLACTGVFGTVAYTVSRRVREIGIRVALGAGHADVLRLIVRQGMRPVVIGMAIGLPGAAAVSTVLARMLFGLSPHDPVSFVIVPCVLFAIALLACYIPARKALCVEPTRALRAE
jgi:ABC-type antimicrobial peptide transport system permease subunit